MAKIRGFGPMADEESRILILGSMPSETSLRLNEYYGNKTNQFWKILAMVFNVEEPVDYGEKKDMLRKARVALWDVLKSCDRQGSLDAAIRRGTVNEIPKFLKRHRKIRGILLNGKTAEGYFKKTVAAAVEIPFAYVPSSSCAHAALGLPQKIAFWKKALSG